MFSKEDSLAPWQACDWLETELNLHPELPQSDLFIPPPSFHLRFRRSAGVVVIGVGLLTWCIAAPHWPIINALFISGPLVGSLIWPLIAGLFWKRINRALVLAGIVLGGAFGVWAYFAHGWFTGSLVGAGVSMIATIAACFLTPTPFQNPDKAIKAV